MTTQRAIEVLREMHQDGYESNAFNLSHDHREALRVVAGLVDRYNALHTSHTTLLTALSTVALRIEIREAAGTWLSASALEIARIVRDAIKRAVAP